MVAAVGSGAQGNFRTCRSSCGSCGAGAVTVIAHGNGVGIFLEDRLDLDVVRRHGELVAADGHIAADHLPLLEVVAAVGSGAQSDLSASRSSCGSCAAAAVAIVLDGNGVGGRCICQLQLFLAVIVDMGIFVICEEIA